MNFTEVHKEELLEFWTKVVREEKLRIRYGERVEAIERTATGFEVRTGRGTFRSRAVLLAIGRRGTPRRLNVPGEERSKVVYRLTDPEQYAGQHVLVVGGGDSALEAAGSIALETDAKVTLSYRSEAFSRAKPKNRTRVDQAIKSGRLKLMLKSQVAEIGEDHVDLEWQGRRMRMKNDAVIVCAGGILPTNFLKSIGVEIQTKYGTA
jgi:thioredoxin reductase